MTREETWNGPRQWDFDAHYFELLGAPAAVDIKIYGDSGQVLADDKGVKPGYFHDRRGLAAFKRVEITNSASQTVKGLFSDGLSGTKAFSPQWYDRNPVERTASYSASALAPHGTTTRWTYTVPTGKKFQVQSLQATALRDVVAAPAGYASAQVRTTPSGGSATSMVAADNVANAVGNGVQLPAAFSATLLAGAVLDAVTSDTSTGGSHLYRLHMHGIEFDA